MTKEIIIDGYSIPVDIQNSSGYYICSLNTIIAVGVISPTEESAIENTKKMFLRIRQIGMKNFLHKYGIYLNNEIIQ